MERILDFYRPFAKKVNVIEKKEDFQTYILSAELNSIDSKNVNFKKLMEFDYLFSNRDFYEFNISIDGGEPFIIKSSFDIKTNHEVIEEIYNLLDEDCVVNIKLEISKKQKDNTTSIYDINTFSEYLSKLKLEHILNQLTKFIDFETTNFFEVIHSDQGQIFFKSHLMTIGTKGYLSQQNHTGITRYEILTNRTINTSPQTFSKYEFLPSDFENNEQNINSSGTLQNMFHKLKIILSFSFIANSSYIHGDQIHFNIYNHKHLEIICNYHDLEVKDAEIFFEIYKWVYESGDSHDKLQLARNIITRHFKESENKWILPNETINSIKSAHSIYLKKNVEKYIETKNKISEISAELSLKSKEINQYFISSFKNNNLTLLTYFISLFIFNTLSSGNQKIIFTLEKYYLSMIFLLISSIYLLITRNQLSRDIKVNIRYFYSMKRIYLDIFDKKELNNLFNKKHLSYNIKNIVKTVNSFSIFWLIEVILLWALSIYLTFFLM